MESRQVVGIVGVFQRQHRNGVRHRGKARADAAMHPLGRRVRSDQLGMRLLQVTQLPVQRVVFAVADLRLVVKIVQPVVAADGLAQGVDALFDVVWHG